MCFFLNKFGSTEIIDIFYDESGSQYYIPQVLFW